MLQVKHKEIIKRDGRKVEFNPEKITNVIFKAAQSVGGHDEERAMFLTQKVLDRLNESSETPTVERVQDLVEKVLIDNGHASTAKAFILYREKRKDLRSLKSNLLDGLVTNLKISITGLQVLKERYLRKDENGKIIETPEELFRRVAKEVAKVDAQFNVNLRELEETFYELMTNFEFLPSSPILMNVGMENPQCCSCFVLPVNDDIESIFSTLKDAVKIQKSGGGTGFSFSRLRPRNDKVKTDFGVASGPLKFMNVFDAAMSSIKQGGKRQGANMGVLRVDHPDILEFITFKEQESMKNFNLSVGLTEDFMRAVINNEEYDLIHPRTGKVIKRISALYVFDLMLVAAWRTGDPGILFLDRINKSNSNPVPELGPLETTGPCGEQPLYDYESTPHGSINLSKFISEGKIDMQKLKKTVWSAINFLDNIVELTVPPIKVAKEMNFFNRRIALGVMGFADLLLNLGIPYNSPEALETAKKLMKFINEEAHNASSELAKQKGPFSSFNKSILDKELRNASITTISPTGSISMIADCSPGIEPLFALSYFKRVLGGKELFYVNECFARSMRKSGVYDEELIRRIASEGSVQHLKEVPEEIKRVFVVSHDIDPYWHVKMQAAFQEYVDNAVSKTVNFPSTATTKDVEKVYMLAYQLGCKGITIYRDQSKKEQVINLQN
ncbi:adenosylcobalamin-dependent ribonucleoside-diphosphate reductase [Candidatus Woesearchaeota archaeon]|nr:adenosylcobalamin-dependent ribonucleoside-diphosphate reductase [Candidatus Woesearchaeota archaeon]